jgi:hypothetical protein
MPWVACWSEGAHFVRPRTTPLAQFDSPFGLPVGSGRDVWLLGRKAESRGVWQQLRGCAWALTMSAWLLGSGIKGVGDWPQLPYMGSIDDP